MFIENIRRNLPDIPANFSPDTVVHSAGSLSAMHLHDELELLFCIEGSIRIDFITDSTVISAGDVIFINERTPHKTAAIAPRNRAPLLQVSLRSLLRKASQSHNHYLSAFLNEQIPSFFVFKKGSNTAAELTGYYHAMEAELNGRRPAYQDYIKGYIYLTISALERQNVLTDSNQLYHSESIRRLEPVFQYICQHYDQPVTLEDMSRTMNLNPSYLCRMFKQATGSTINSYLNFVRIYEAEKLLRTSSMSITEIGMATGFSDPVYFDRVFKRFKGCTPSAYKRFKYSHLAT